MKELIKKITFEKMISVLQTLILAFGLGFSSWQIYDLNNNQTARMYDLYTRIYDRLNTSTNKKISIAIQNNDSLEKFTNDELDDYLSEIQSIDDSIELNLIRSDFVCYGFYDLIDKATKNQELKSYLRKIRMSDKEYYSGFENLEEYIKNCK